MVQDFLLSDTGYRLQWIILCIELVLISRLPRILAFLLYMFVLLYLVNGMGIVSHLAFQ